MSNVAGWGGEDSSEAQEAAGRWRGSFHGAEEAAKAAAQEEKEPLGAASKEASGWGSARWRSCHTGQHMHDPIFKFKVVTLCFRRVHLLRWLSGNRVASDRWGPVSTVPFSLY